MATLVAGTVNYNGKELLDYLIRPLKELLLPSGIRVIRSNRAGKVSVPVLGNLSNVLMPYASGWQGGTDPANLKREFELGKFKTELGHDIHDYADTVLEQLLSMEGDNDFEKLPEGKKLLAARNKILMDAIRNDIVKLFWLADSAKTVSGTGTFFNGTTWADGDDDLRYNQFNGVWKQIITNIAEIQSASASGSLAADQAEEMFKETFVDAPKVLKSLKNKGALAFYCTDSIIENYEDTIRGLTGIESGFSAMVNGVKTLAWNGIPILPMGVDAEINDDFGTNVDRMILTSPNNLALVVSEGQDFANAKMWFSEDNNENRTRAQFMMGSGYVLPELLSVNYLTGS